MNSSIKFSNGRQQKYVSPFPHREADKIEEIRGEANMRAKNSKGILIRSKITYSGFQDAVSRLNSTK